MFDMALLHNPSSSMQRQAVKARVYDLLRAGQFTYTELLVSPEPLRSFALEALDGIIVEGTIPKYQDQPETWDGAKLLLVHVEPDGHIKHPVKTQVKVPGTNQVIPEEGMKDFGNVAEVSDVPGERLARMILYQNGWPIRQVRTKGSHAGAVVEWRWLKKEAASAAPADGVLDLYREILSRPAMSGEAAAIEAASKSDTIKSKPPAREARAGV